MKIDEPPTPFNYDYAEGADDQEEGVDATPGSENRALPFGLPAADGGGGGGAEFSAGEGSRGSRTSVPSRPLCSVQTVPRSAVSATAWS
jgi:hypothetical protein